MAHGSCVLPRRRAQRVGSKGVVGAPPWLVTEPSRPHQPAGRDGAGETSDELRLFDGLAGFSSSVEPRKGNYHGGPTAVGERERC
jgi:hypothetical protein